MKEKRESLDAPKAVWAVKSDQRKPAQIGANLWDSTSIVLRVQDTYTPSLVPRGKHSKKEQMWQCEEEAPGVNVFLILEPSHGK